MKTLSLHGDCSSIYDASTGAGMLHKIVGPDARGRWHQVVSAVYDPATDTTLLGLDLMPHPSRRLDEIVG